jgi:hypothetical protein
MVRLSCRYDAKLGISGCLARWTSSFVRWSRNLDCLSRRGLPHVSACLLWDESSETMQQLLVSCPYSLQIRCKVLYWIQSTGLIQSTDDAVMDWWTRRVSPLWCFSRLVDLELGNQNCCNFNWHDITMFKTWCFCIYGWREFVRKPMCWRATSNQPSCQSRQRVSSNVTMAWFSLALRV